MRKYRQGKKAGLVDLASLSLASEGDHPGTASPGPYPQRMSQFLGWCVGEGELRANPCEALKVKDRPDVHSHGVLTDDQVRILLSAKDRVLHHALLWAAHRPCALGRFVGSWLRTSQQKIIWDGLSVSGLTRSDC